MAEFLVEVYAPTLVSRRAHFPAFPANDPLGYPGELYLPGEDLQAEMRRRGMIANDALVLTAQVQLGHSEPDGRTKRGSSSGWHDVLNGVRFKFVLEAENPPDKREVRPWELKKVTPMDELP